MPEAPRTNLDNNPNNSPENKGLIGREELNRGQELANKFLENQVNAAKESGVDQSKNEALISQLSSQIASLIAREFPSGSILKLDQSNHVNISVSPRYYFDKNKNIENLINRESRTYVEILRLESQLRELAEERSKKLGSRISSILNIFNIGKTLQQIDQEIEQKKVLIEQNKLAEQVVKSEIEKIRAEYMEKVGKSYDLGIEIEQIIENNKIDSQTVATIITQVNQILAKE